MPIVEYSRTCTDCGHGFCEKCADPICCVYEKEINSNKFLCKPCFDNLKKYEVDDSAFIILEDELWCINCLEVEYGQRYGERIKRGNDGNYVLRKFAD